MKRLLMVGCCLFLGLQISSAQGLDPTYADAENLSAEEKIERASKAVKLMRESLKAALGRLQLAQDKNDIIQVNCVRDKLAAIKGLLKIAEQADVSMKEASVRGDQDLVNHEYTKISIAAVRAENFRTEVDGCVGEASQYTGQTNVELTVEGEERSDDPSADDELLADVDSVLDERPPAATASE